MTATAWPWRVSVISSPAWTRSSNTGSAALASLTVTVPVTVDMRKLYSGVQPCTIPVATSAARTVTNADGARSEGG